MQSQGQGPARGLRTRTVSLAVSAILPLVLPPASNAQSLRTAPGFAAASALVPRATKAWVGLDLLPDGSLVSFDGQRLCALDPKTGAIRRVVARLKTAVFGSDCATGPSGKTVYFGESSTGAIYEATLATGVLRKVTSLGGNFSLAFHPREGERFLYASARPGFTGTAKVFRVDTVTGASDLIAEAIGFAGPILFAPSGDLYTAPAPLKFSTPGLGRILRFDAAKVLAAIGPKALKEGDATVFAKSFDNAFSFARDTEGSFYLCDTSFKTASLVEIGASGGSGFARDVLKHASESPTYLVLARGARPFERFGSAGSRFYLLTTDFSSSTHLVTLAPARPGLRAVPTTDPLPGSPLSLVVERAPAGVPAVWLFGAGLVPERPLLPLGAGGLAFPDFGVVLSAPLLVLPAGITSAGGATTLAFKAPASAGFRWTSQCLLLGLSALKGGAPASPILSSAALTIRVR